MKSNSFTDSKFFAFLFWSVFLVCLFCGWYIVDFIQIGFFIGYLIFKQGSNDL